MEFHVTICSGVSAKNLPYTQIISLLCHSTHDTKMHSKEAEMLGITANKSNRKSSSSLASSNTGRKKTADSLYSLSVVVGE
jgi:hypothetical protein